MPDLSIIIPARQEMFLGNTINSILTNMEGDTEIIVILDGYWPDPPIQDNPRVVIVHHTVPVGQRGGTNEGARMSKSKFLMKLDAHCAVDKGFDVKLMADCEYDWTVIPRMWNLHAFDWQCKKCGKRTYQGPILKVCDEPECGGIEFERVIVWQPRKRTITDFAMFDNNMHFQYWREYGSRPQAQGDIADVMCSVGACWFMHRERFWELEGMDETHGSWGQFGVETACKAWLSGGRQVVNKKTWFAHMFRTRHDFSFPYQISGNDQERARIYSRDLWLNNKWNKAKLPLKWLVQKFAPVPTWENIDGVDEKCL